MPAATVTAVVAAQQSAIVAAVITGVGATDAVWERTHTADPQANAGMAYNPGPDGQDEYAAVNHADGHVLSYILYLPQVMTATAAKDVISNELPFDAQLEGDKTKDACEILLYKSALLGDALADPKIGDADGWVGVVFSSPDLDHYDPQRVLIANISIGWPGFTSGKC